MKYAPEMSFKVPKYLIFTYFLINSLLAHSQSNDADSAGVQNEFAYELSLASGIIDASEDFLPHYLIFNRWGAVQENNNAFISGELDMNYQFNQNWSFKAGGAFRNDLVYAGFGQLDFKKWSLIGGKKKLFYGDVPGDLSSGSLGIGPNAEPIPMLEIRLNEYVNVPFTKGYFKIKGNYSHRWLGQDRFISGAQMHGKALYGMIDLDKEIGLKMGSGIIHFGQYGGTTPEGEDLPSSFNDYLRVVLGKGSSDSTGVLMGEENGLGNHLGLTEIFFEKRIGEHSLRLNYQKQFEDQGSMQYVSLKDYLLSIEWTLPKKGLLEKIRFEWLESKHQSGKGLPDPTEKYPDEESNMGQSFGERDDYYNNFLFESAWTNHGMVIGNPLFLTYDRTLNYFDPYPRYEEAVTNNRISGIHLGLEGSFSSNLNYRLILTYSKNFGTYAGLYEGRFEWEGIATDPDFDYVFLDGKTQFYSLFQLNYGLNIFNQNARLYGMFAFDSGELYSNYGAELGIEFVLNSR